jgi:hypothetical protein
MNGIGADLGGFTADAWRSQQIRQPARLIAVRFQADRGYLLPNLINVPRQKFGDLFDRCSERKPALNVDEFSFRPGFTGSYAWGDCHDVSPPFHCHTDPVMIGLLVAT